MSKPTDLLCPSCKAEVAGIIRHTNEKTDYYFAIPPEGAYLICFGCLGVSRIVSGKLVEVPPDEPMPAEIILAIKDLEIEFFRRRHLIN